MSIFRAYFIRVVLPIVAALVGVGVIIGWAARGMV